MAPAEHHLLPAIRATFSTRKLAGGAVALGAVVALGAANGGFFPDSWGPALVLLASVVGLQLLVDRRPSFPLRGAALLAIACAVAAWTAVGAIWSDSATASLLEAERSLVVVAAVLALLLADRAWIPRAVVAAVTFLAAWNLLASDAANTGAPVGYANTLGALAAIAIPLALRERVTWPALAILVPELVVSGSRGAWLALLLAALVATARRPVLLVPAIVVAVAVAWVAEGPRHGYYKVALDEARAAPIVGTGAGTWEQWWLARRHEPRSALDAHSVYLETVGEQGIVGLTVLGVLVALPLTTRPRDRLLLAAYATFVVHAAVDWDREMLALWLAGVAVGICLLPEPRRRLDARRAGALGVAAASLAALGVLFGVAHLSLARASDAARARQFARAEALAHRAARIQPWSSRPLEVLGEAQLAAGDRGAAAATFRRALAKDPGRWRLWFDIANATGSRRAGREAARLNPLGG